MDLQLTRITSAAIMHSHSDDTKLCYYSCWGCKRIISTTDNQTIFGTDQVI